MIRPVVLAAAAVVGAGLLPACCHCASATNSWTDGATRITALSATVLRVEKKGVPPNTFEPSHLFLRKIYYFEGERRNAQRK